MMCAGAAGCMKLCLVGCQTQTHGQLGQGADRGQQLLVHATSVQAKIYGHILQTVWMLNIAMSVFSHHTDSPRPLKTLGRAESHPMHAMMCLVQLFMAKSCCNIILQAGACANVNATPCSAPFHLTHAPGKYWQPTCKSNWMPYEPSILHTVGKAHPCTLNMHSRVQCKQETYHRTVRRTEPHNASMAQADCQATESSLCQDSPSATMATSGPGQTLN